MRMRRIVVLLLAFALCLCGAAEAKSGRRHKRAKQYDCSGNIQKAIARYNRGRYNDARALLDQVRMQCGGHSAIDTAEYYLGMTLLRGDLAVEAAGEFKRLISNYPNSPFSEEAHFRVGQCSYQQSNKFDRDQTQTGDAIRELTDFVEVYSQSPWADSARMYLQRCGDKLAQKDYATARFYHRIDKYDAAVVYYRGLIQEYPASRYVPDAKLYLAQALDRIDRVTEAQAVVAELLEGSYADDIKRKARLLEVRLGSKGRK